MELKVTVVLLIASSVFGENGFQTVNVADLPKTKTQPENGAKTFIYYSTTAENYARIVEAYLANLDKAVIEYLAQLEETYNKCNDIGNTIQNCKESLPSNYREALDDKVLKTVIEIQKIDNKMKINSNICTSLRFEEPEGCKKSRESATNDLNNLLSKRNLQEFEDLFVSAFSKAQDYIVSCVENKTGKSNC